MKSLTMQRAKALILMACALVTVSAAVSAGDDIISGKGSTASETGLGNLVSDAVRRFTGADVAIVPGSGLRDVDIKLSELSADAVTAALVDPDQPVVVVSLKGAQLREALERSVSLAPKPSNGFLQVSGISFSYSLAGASGKRVGDIMLGRRAVRPDDDLRVAMPSELASGGYGYFRVWGNLKPSGKSPGAISDALSALLSGKVDATKYLPDGRIRRSQ